MILKNVTGGIVAGAAAGLLTGLLQLAFVQPVLLHAELYEAGVLVHRGAEAISAHREWSGIDPARDGLSLLFSMLVYVGYGLLLTAAMALAPDEGGSISPRAGAIWGVCGFVAAHLAPAFSLPPEVPGSAHVDLSQRQIWWHATVVVTAVALWLLAFGRGVWSIPVAAVLLLAPHVIGAPQPEHFEGPVPQEIAALFASRALGAGLAGWVLLGAILAWLRRDARVDFS
ncbi:CbtA family protein [Tropicimonas isoalkanivorans]|uniref:Cobalt transporter subunit CbtA n=1 Tax=Tropicimonas isoalkanivorans TaxID=441112 RepID=A0A1I1MPR9_9RHOB|nr:CbtA family protein [Tropicimonas isoalkanivorans]SFC86862.1 cobalt transporter subunit CbtA [Tropicimonas isoalkanivorans]